MLPLHRHQAVYLHALGVELGLVVRHHAHGAVFVQVARHLAQFPAAGGQLLHAPLKERGVVGLEPDLPTRRERGGAELLEAGRGEPALELLLLRPGVGEIYVYAPRFALREEFAKLRGVPVEEAHVVKLRGANALHGYHHGVRHLLDGHEEHVRVLLRHAGGEAALAAAELDVQLGKRPLAACEAAHIIQPAAPVLLRRRLQDGGAALHARLQVGFLSHSHIFHAPSRDDTTFRAKHQ